jgi:hypothetical protein
MSKQIAASGKSRQILFLILLAIAGQAALAQTAQSGRDSDLFPARLNDAWTFDASGRRQSAAFTVNVTRVRRSGEAKEATLEWLAADGYRTQTEIYRISASEVARVATGQDGECRYSPPLPILRYPLANGRRWTWKGTLQFQHREVSGEAVMTASGPTTLQAPAGAFQAMRVHCDLILNVDGQSVSQPTDCWFAPGVGIVQQRMQSGDSMIEGRLAAYNLRRSRLGARPSAPASGLPGLHLMPKQR